VTSSVASPRRPRRRPTRLTTWRAKRKLADQKRELREARAEEAKQRKIYRAYDAEWQQGKKYQALIDKQTSLANQATSEMRTADSRDDQRGYDAAKTKRLNALRQLGTLLVAAKRALKDQDSAAADALQEQISSNDADIADTGSDQSQAQSQAERDAQQAADDEASRLADTGMDAAERARYSALQKDVAFAALTKPLDDDLTAAQSLETFLETVLGEAPGRGISDDVQSDLAQAVKQARDNITSITTGGSNSNAELQAQIDQANERARTADESARINAQALATFSGFGDIGSDGNSALGVVRGQPGLTVSFQSYVPPSPQEALRLAGHVASGFAYQPAAPSKSTRVG
jgi:hypothetical protein